MIRPLALPLLALFAASLFAEEPKKDPPAKISYFKDVRPILQQNCQGCHQPAKSMGGFNMTVFADLMKKGDREKPGVVPGKPKESFLVELIQVHDGKAEMPRQRDPLSNFQIKRITEWVAQGAVDDTPASASAPLVDAEHPPVYKQLPVITSLAYAPDGNTLAISGYHEVLLYKADGSELVARLVGLSETVQSVAFSPDGKWLAVSGGNVGSFGEIQIWNVEKQKLKISIPATYDIVYGVSWSPDSTKVACGCGDNTLRAFDINDGKQILFQGAHGDWTLGTAFSIDGEFIVSVSRDRTVKLTELATQRFIDNVTSITPGALKGGLAAIDIRPMKTPRKVKQNEASGNRELTYNELLTAGADGTPRLYKMHRETKRVIGDDANKIREYEKLPGRIFELNFNRDGNLFAAGSSLDGAGEVRVYEVDSGKKVATFEGCKTPVFSVVFSPDSKVVASGGTDGKVRLNDAQSGKLIKEFNPFPGK
jgi:WD40 repeat protein/mono/diheme cytochrome c family protein